MEKEYFSKKKELPENLKKHKFISTDGVLIKVFLARKVFLCEAVGDDPCRVWVARRPSAWSGSMMISFSVARTGNDFRRQLRCGDQLERM